MNKVVAMIRLSGLALACLLPLTLSASGPAPNSSEAALLKDTTATPALHEEEAEDRGLIVGPDVDPVPGQSRRRADCEQCLPVARCAFAINAGERQSSCVLQGGGPGVCCPRRAPSPPALERPPLLTQPARHVAMADVPLSIINNSSRHGMLSVADTIELEDYLLRSHQYLDHQTAARGHLNFFRVTHEAVQDHRNAQKVWEASSIIADSLKLTKDQRLHGMKRFRVASSLLSSVCPTEPICDPSTPYRSVDGSCNNLARPLYGVSHTAFQRIRDAQYEDGVNSPKALSVTGASLPPVRTVSSMVLPDRNVPDPRITLSVMQFSQFIDHDLTHSPFPALNDNTEGIECCPDGVEATGPTRHPSCFPIPVPESDPFYGPRNLRCINFVRSMQALNQDCTFGVAEQMNQITHFLDSSNVYGSTSSQADRLRLREGGLLPTSPGNLLPFDPERMMGCDGRQTGAICYFAGDSRVNEIPGLTAMHILFHRQHNRLAQGLAMVNPSWQDERLFQEARKINEAIQQHIVFNEWLPIIIGQSSVERYGLGVGRPRFSNDYDEQVNPNIQSEFATAAFRYGHTLVQGVIRLFDEDGQVNVLRLREHFNSPHIYQAQPGTVDLFARSLIRESGQTFDAFITEDLSNHLFQTPIHDFGMDLMSLNLQRGRDHGIASYNDIREACGLTRARTFGDFNDQIKMTVINRLREVYAHPDDVELFAGGISETSAGDGLLGYTFRCVVADGFARAKRGDRFFYDHGGQTGSLTRTQLSSIQGMSWARVICDNTDTVRRVQPLGFLAAEEDGPNALQDCTGGGIPELDLSLWRE